MAKAYTTDIKQFLSDAGELLPGPARRKAEFLAAIVDAVTPKCPTIGHNTGIRCRKAKGNA
jgi:hypothetical protein